MSSLPRYIPLRLLLGTALVLAAVPTVSACSCSEEPEVKQPVPTDGLAPRRPIDGLHGVETLSVLRYVAAPDEERAFEAVYVFPDRVRWEFQLATGDARRVYRAGEELYYSQGGPSQALEGVQRDRLLGELELRRALLLYPHGFEWEETERGLEADMGRAGRLRVSIDEESELPTILALHAPDGKQLESFRRLTWRTARGRRWPVSMEFWHGGSHLWNETFERTAPARYVDSFFTPADRREQVTPSEAAQGLQPLQPFTSFRLDLPPKTGWDDALKREREERSRWAEKLPKAEIAPRPTFVLGEDGEPVAALLRIEPPMASPPKGWSQQAARQGIASFTSFDALSKLDRGRIEWMRSKVPLGASPGAPYARVDPEAGLVQLVQPFVP